MSPELIMHLGRRGLETALMVSAPVLVVTLVVGFLVAMLQAVTSIRDMTMGLVVKLASVAITLLLAGGWMMNVAVGFAREVFTHIEAAGH